MDSIFITLQKVRPLFLVELESHGGAAIGDIRHKLLAHAYLNLLGSQRFIPADSANVRGNRNPSAI